jgi:hypothetical protein
MQIIEQIINNNIDKVKELITNRSFTPYSLEPEYFLDQFAKEMKRGRRKTLIEIAHFLKRSEILEIMDSFRDSMIEKKMRITLAR